MFAAGCTPLGAGERALSSAAATGSGRATAQRGRRRCTVPCCVQASSGPRRNQPPPAGAATGGSSAWASVISLAAAAPAGVFEQTPGEAEVVSAAGSPSTTAAKTSPPLKINADLALYWARVKSWEAKRASGPTRRALRASVRELYNKALMYDPTDGRPYLGLARLLEQDGRTEDARRVYDQGTRATEGENAFLWQAWAVLEERAGNPGTARRLYDAATVADKRHAAAWHAWGMLEKRQGNYQRARDLFMQGLRLIGDRPGVEFLHQSLGVMAAERGRADDARAHFAAGARTGPGKRSPALWHAWGRMEQSLGHGARARLLFQRALRASPTNNHTWLAWAQLEHQLGCTTRARELFRQGAALNPTDVVLLQGWGVFEASLGRLAVARALFERGVGADPSHQAVWQAWGVAEASAGNVDTARQLFQRGVWANPQSVNAATCYQAWACLETRAGNNPRLARQLFRAALRLDPASVPTWHGWAHMEESLGNDARAAELRALCLQQRAEEAVGLADIGMDASQLLRPLLDTVSGWFTSSGAEAAGQQVQPQASAADQELMFLQQGNTSASSDDSERRLGADEGVLGIQGLLRETDAQAARAAAADLDSALRQARGDTADDADVAKRVRALIDTLGGMPDDGGVTGPLGK